MKNTYLILFLLIFSVKTLKSQEDNKEKPLEISGSVDTYWKYDFQNKPNINTYFTEDNNSVSIGMVDLALKKSFKKASFVGELSFGPRGQYRSIMNGDGQPGDDKNSFHIQNLYVGYNLTDKLNLTAGFMGTFVGFEVISPTYNFHYSTSYLFGAGPFQDAGLKATYSFSDKFALMVGIFNDWNVYQDMNGVSHVGSQLTYRPNEKGSFYLNFLTGSSAGGKSNYSSGTLVDFVGNYDFTPKFYLGLNATHYKKRDDGGYTGVALYPRYHFSEHFGLGLREEFFQTHKEEANGIESANMLATTLTAEYNYHGFKFIPEVRIDRSNREKFIKNDLSPTKSAGQFLLACVYSF
ncbi:outer membrane beta-barrel protein [Sphingobacterium thalpophilum]|uniref:outer membrane beta-barrel protein n=1 Tax=Sphingobacterium thalpophilum TaxID=259 RepID=UPI003C744835